MGDINLYDIKADDETKPAWKEDMVWLPAFFK